MPLEFDGYGNGSNGSNEAQLVSNAEAEEYLGTTFANQDVLTRWIAAVETALARKSGRQGFSALDATEFHDGNGEIELWLRRWPVLDIADVRVDACGGYGEHAGTFGDDSAIAVGTQFTVPLLADQLRNRGRLVRTDGRRWPIGFGNVRVSYLGGYDPIPDDLKLLVCKLLKSNLAAQATGIEGCASSVTHGQFSITFADRDRDELDSITSLMARFMERT